MKQLKCLALLLILSLSSVSFAYEELWDTPGGRERIFNAVVDVFRENYWDDSYRDWDTWGAQFKEDAVNAGSRLEFDSTLRRMINELGDDHSRWIGLGASFDPNPEVAAPLEPGLGIRHQHLRHVGLVIERVYAGTPAEAAGLRRGDVITRIGSRDLRDIEGAYEVSAILSGAVQNGDVRLGVRRHNQNLTMNVTPAPLDFERLADSPQAYMLDTTTGYLYIPSFQGDGLAEQVHRLIKSLQDEGATSLVLDLRDNPGGRLGELGLVLGAFIDGPWVEAVSHGEVIWRSSYQTEIAQNILEDLEGKSISQSGLSIATHFDGPLALIVTQQNSSAGEIAALVLQDLGRATIVGEPTLGNVEAIQVFDLPDGSLVYVAVANLQGISGTNYTLGVKPDIEVTDSLQELARGYDAPVAEALRALKELPFTPGKFF